MKRTWKKLFAFVCAFTLVAAPSTFNGDGLWTGADGTIVSAAGNSTDYTITIPPTLDVSNSGWNATDGITAAVKSGDTFDTNKKLTVTATSTNSWALKSSENAVGYNLATAEGTYSSGATPASWEFSAAELNAESGTNKAMGIIVEDYSAKPAGNYSDTVIFTAKVENAGIPVSSITINNAPTEALFVNSTGTLTATVLPNDATDKTVTWTSSNPDYVSINETTGEYEVKATNGYGSATITATAGEKSTTCTITGKVTYTSLSVGTVLHVGDTFYTGGTVYFNAETNVSFNTSAGVITLVVDNGKYKFKRGSNGTMPNMTSYNATSNTDGIYITGGSGTSSSSRFTLAVHNK